MTAGASSLEAGLADQSLEGLGTLGIVEHLGKSTNDFADSSEIHGRSVKDEQTFGIFNIPWPRCNQLVDQ